METSYPRLLEQKYNRLRRKRWLSLLLVLILTLAVDAGFYLSSRGYITQALKGPAQITDQDISDIFDASFTEDFTATGLDQRYYKVKFETEEYLTDTFISSWEWGTEYTDGSYETDYAFAFLIFYSESEELSYIFHARVRVDEIDQLLDLDTTEYKVMISDLPAEELEFINGVDEIVAEEDASAFDEVAALEYELINEYLNAELIPDNIVFDINFNTPTPAAYWLIPLLVLEILTIIIFLFRAITKGTRDLSDHLKGQLDQDELLKLTAEMEQIRLQYHNGGTHLLLTPAYLIDLNKVEIMPYHKISQVKENVIQNSAGGILGALLIGIMSSLSGREALTQHYLEIRVSDARGKANNKRYEIKDKERLHEILTMIEQNLDRI